MVYKKPIYLHILDRELQQTLESPLSENIILQLLRIALFATQHLYISFSHLCESSLDYPKVKECLLSLQSQGEIDFLLADKELDTFYEKRQKLYYFDRDRYPFYFSRTELIKPLALCVPRESSSTSYIRSRLNEIKNYDIRVRHLNASKNPYVVELLDKHFPEDPHQALTIRAFDRAFVDSNIFRTTDSETSKKQASKDLKDALSYFHSGCILAETQATIITDIPGCTKYDTLALDSSYSYPIYEILLSPLTESVPVSDYSGYEKQLQTIVEFRNSEFFPIFSNGIFKIAQSIFAHENRNHSDSLNYSIWLKQLCRKLKRYVDHIARSGSFKTINVECAARYFAVLNMMVEKNYSGRKDEFMEIKEKSIVVILTANNAEHRAALTELEKLGIEYTPVACGANVYFHASLDNNEIYILKCMPGSIGSGGSSLTVHDAITQLRPSAVIAGGVAFGCKKDSQNLGDILVSRQIWQYDPQKQTEESIIRRGDKSTASPALLSRFSTAATLWEREHPGISVHTGLIASGEVLSNSVTFVEELKKSEPEIIGGEMEGAGILSATEREKCDWIVVKAICDWGAKKTDGHQPQAAENAFQFIFYTLQQFPIE